MHMPAPACKTWESRERPDLQFALQASSMAMSRLEHKLPWSLLRFSTLRKRERRRKVLRQSYRQKSIVPRLTQFFLDDHHVLQRSSTLSYGDIQNLSSQLVSQLCRDDSLLSGRFTERSQCGQHSRTSLGYGNGVLKVRHAVAHPLIIVTYKISKGRGYSNYPYSDSCQDVRIQAPNTHSTGKDLGSAGYVCQDIQLRTL